MGKLAILVSAVRLTAAMILNRPGISLDEVEHIYKSGENPGLNERIDYILQGL